MTTINSIIKRLESAGCSAVAVLEDWIQTATTENNNFEKISGMMWGLYAAGTISKDEKRKAIDEIWEYLHPVVNFD